MITLRAISNLPLDYVESKKTLTLRGLSIVRNYSPKFVVIDKIGNPISNANLTMKFDVNEYNLTSDDSGNIEIDGNITRNELYDIKVTASGFQSVTGNMLLPLGFKENVVVLNKVNTLITTSSGYAVNLKPTDPENKSFN